MVVAPNRGFSRSSNLPVSLKFTSNRPLLPWQQKIGNFSTKLARTRLIRVIEPRMLHQTGGFRGHAIYWCRWNLH